MVMSQTSHIIVLIKCSPITVNQSDAKLQNRGWVSAFQQMVIIGWASAKFIAEPPSVFLLSTRSSSWTLVYSAMASLSGGGGDLSEAADEETMALLMQDHLEKNQQRV